jgi:hypothetical protein
MEPKQIKANLYIDPIFDSNQTWIWTSDPHEGAAGAQWVVYFYGGNCSSKQLNDINYVRAVRFGHSSP